MPTFLRNGAGEIVYYDWSEAAAVGRPKEKIRIEPVSEPVPEKTPAPVETPTETPEQVPA